MAARPCATQSKTFRRETPAALLGLTRSLSIVGFSAEKGKWEERGDKGQPRGRDMGSVIKAPLRKPLLPICSHDGVVPLASAVGW